MWVTSGILMVGILISYVEAPYLIRKRLIKELMFFFTILLFGIVLSILLAFRVKLPNPIDWITFLFKPISDFVYNLL